MAFVKHVRPAFQSLNLPLTVLDKIYKHRLQNNTQQRLNKGKLKHNSIICKQISIQLTFGNSFLANTLSRKQTEINNAICICSINQKYVIGVEYVYIYLYIHMIYLSVCNSRASVCFSQFVISERSIYCQLLFQILSVYTCAHLCLCI